LPGPCCRRLLANSLKTLPDICGMLEDQSQKARMIIDVVHDGVPPVGRVRKARREMRLVISHPELRAQFAMREIDPTKNDYADLWNEELPRSWEIQLPYYH